MVGCFATPSSRRDSSSVSCVSALEKILIVLSRRESVGDRKIRTIGMRIVRKKIATERRILLRYAIRSTGINNGRNAREA